MFKEILHILPKLDSAALEEMQRSLSRRFTSMAKKFGKGLVAALTGGGIAGVALGLVDKILNPLKETQEAIDRALKQGDDVVTNAKQFGTTAGKLFRLQQLGKSTGLDESSLDVLITKFQGAIAEAVADPKKITSVRKFIDQVPDPSRPGALKAAADQGDIASKFFEFIQSIQKLDSIQRVQVQQEVFGEKQILKMADFLQTDFTAQSKLIGGPTSAKLTPALEKTAALNDLKDALEAKRNLEDALKKSRVINQGMVKSQDAQARLELDKENKQIGSYKDLAAISIAATELTNLAKQGVLGLTTMLVKVTDLTNNVRKLMDSRVVKGIIKTLGGS